MKKIILITTFAAIIMLLFTACTTNTPLNNTNLQDNQSNECSSDSDCMKSGCSGQLCIPKSQKQDSFTICDFKPEYECYSNQNCICKNSKCGWSDDRGLNRCITEKSKITA